VSWAPAPSSTAAGNERCSAGGVSAPVAEVRAVVPRAIGGREHAGDTLAIEIDPLGAITSRTVRQAYRVARQHVQLVADNRLRIAELERRESRTFVSRCRRGHAGLDDCSEVAGDRPWSNVPWAIAPGIGVGEVSRADQAGRRPQLGEPVNISTRRHSRYVRTSKVAR